MTRSTLLRTLHLPVMRPRPQASSLGKAPALGAFSSGMRLRLCLGCLARECGFSRVFGWEAGLAGEIALAARFFPIPSASFLLPSFPMAPCLPVSLGAPWRRPLRHVLPSGFAWNPLLRWPFLCWISVLLPALRSWTLCHRLWASGRPPALASLAGRPAAHSKASCGPPLPFNAPLRGCRVQK